MNKVSNWHSMKESVPAEGAAVIILNTNNNPDVGYYCDGDFYFLEYDPHLGVLRKQHIPYKVKFWKTIDEE